MSIRVVVARGSRITGNLLQSMLEGVAGNATVSYGVRLTPGERVLNALAGGADKYTELECLAKAGINVPRFWRASDIGGSRMELPVLGRRFNHRGGTDIRLCGTAKSVRFWSERRDFFTKFINSDREYRVWMYRNSHLGTYEKILRHPDQQTKMVGRNHGNGYAFELVASENVPREAVEAARKTIAALGLDFGAVDIIRERESGKFYVLESNSAPGVEGEGRQCIQLLAKHVKRWVEKGCPKRKEEEKVVAHERD